MRSKLAELAYRTIEQINGEKGQFQLISYKLGHQIKWKLMDYI